MVPVRSVDELSRNAHLVARSSDASLEERGDVQFFGDGPRILVLPLERKAEVRAATCNPGTFANRSSSSSVSPSAQYS